LELPDGDTRKLKTWFVKKVDATWVVSVEVVEEEVAALLKP
jgi:hypothetical protein